MIPLTRCCRENPNALCLAVIDRESCTAQLEAAAESDIPVILLDSGLKDQTASAGRGSLHDR